MRILFSIFLFLALAACGGGSSGNGNPGIQFDEFGQPLEGNGETPIAGNQSPVVFAGDDVIVVEFQGVTLTGVAQDPDGTVDTILWTQTVGPAVTLSNNGVQIITFDAPDVNANTLLTFAFTATDNEGAEVTDTVDVQVIAFNQQPIVNAGSDQNVAAGVQVNLVATSQDPDGQVASQLWEQTSGAAVALTGADTERASFTAPSAASDSALTFSFTATDNLGATATDTVDILVTAGGVVTIGNQPPTVNAGSNQTVTAGTAVNLSGIAQDSDGSISTLQWQQTSGPGVALSSTTAQSTSFVAPALNTTTRLTFTLTATDNQGAVTSDTVDVEVTAVNQSPVVNAGIDQTVTSAAAVTLTGTASDTDGTVSAVSWVQTAGPAVILSNAASLTTTFAAPTVATPTRLTFELTATDDTGTSTTDAVDIQVTLPNQNPTVNAGVDQSVAAGATVTLNGSAQDTDGTISSVQWVQTSGTAVVLANAATQVTTFTLPATATPEQLIFSLTATDDQAGTATDSVTINVAGVNQRPTVNAGVDQSVNGGVVVNLSGSASDADGTVSSVRWLQTSGPSVIIANTAALATNFTAPSVAAATTLSFSLTATDNQGDTNTDTVSINVLGVNQAPTVDAGLAQSVNAGSLVTLNGSAQDSDGTISSVVWQQPGGTAVTLANVGSAITTFTAPATPGALVFSLTATDNGGLSTADSVTITVTAANQAPIVNAGSNAIVGEGAAVNLASTSSDADGTIASQLWEQVGVLVPAITLSGATSSTPSFTAPSVAADTTFTLRLTVTDNDGASTSDTVNVLVQNTVPKPSFQIPENSLAGTVVGKATIEAVDITGWTISKGNTDGAFAIDSATGQITVANSVALDFESIQQFKLGLSGVSQSGILRVEPTIHLTDVTQLQLKVNYPVSHSNLGGVEQVVVSGIVEDTEDGAVNARDINGLTINTANAIFTLDSQEFFKATVPVSSGDVALNLSLLDSDNQQTELALNVQNLPLLDDVSHVNNVLSKQAAISEAKTGAGADIANAKTIVVDSVRDRVLIANADNGAIVAVDLTTAIRTTLSDSEVGAGIDLINPISMALDSAKNRLLVIDQGHSAVLAVNLLNGNRTTLSSRAQSLDVNSSELSSLVLDQANGRLLATDRGLSAVVSIDLISGDQSVVSGVNIGSGLNLATPVASAYDSNGNILYVVDSGTLIAVDIASGQRSLVSSPARGTGVVFNQLVDAVLDATSTRVIVSDQGLKAMLAIDLTTGDRSVLASNGLRGGVEFQRPEGIALDSQRNRLWLVDSQMQGVFVIDTLSGSRAVMAK